MIVDTVIVIIKACVGVLDFTMILGIFLDGLYGKQKSSPKEIKDWQLKKHIINKV